MKTLSSPFNNFLWGSALFPQKMKMLGPREVTILGCFLEKRKWQGKQNDCRAHEMVDKRNLSISLPHDQCINPSWLGQPVEYTHHLSTTSCEPSYRMSTATFLYVTELSERSFNKIILNFAPTRCKKSWLKNLCEAKKEVSLLNDILTLYSKLHIIIPWPIFLSNQWSGGRLAIDLLLNHH